MSGDAGGGGSSWACLRLREEVVVDGGRGRAEFEVVSAAVGMVGEAEAASLAAERVTLGGM